MRDTPDGPVAYCAPGRTVAAALLLTEHAQTVTKIVEHPWLTGREVFIVHPEAFQPLPENMPWAEPPVFGSAEWWQESLLRRIGEFTTGSDAGLEPGPQLDRYDGDSREDAAENFI